MNDFKQLESDIDPLWEAYDANRHLQDIFAAERQIGRCQMLCEQIDKERKLSGRAIEKLNKLRQRRAKWESEVCPF